MTGKDISMTNPRSHMTRLLLPSPLSLSFAAICKIYVNEASVSFALHFDMLKDTYLVKIKKAEQAGYI